MDSEGYEPMILPSLEIAAHDAAVADGLIVSSSMKASDMKAKKAGLRRGKWTTEEEHYANRLIHEFKSGLLPLTDGTTLRTFLSKLLNCDPMRISKKFVGQNCIGKVYQSYSCMHVIFIMLSNLNSKSSVVVNKILTN